MKTLLLHRWQQIRRVGPAAAAQLAWDRLQRVTGSRLRRGVARFRPTGLSDWSRAQPPRRVVPPLALPPDGAEAAWLKHEFDLLGSGPRSLPLASGDPLADLPGAWHATARKLQAMLPADYQPIDWQRDAKSGYRWSARQWSRDVTYGDRAGVDVKWPWELSRLQHLPALAGRIATAVPAVRAALAAEIRAQAIDFILQNPPLFGVNWVCAMDVGIRAANLAVAVDLARAAGVEYDAAFLALVTATLRDHGRFLVGNLEWGARLCSNHYLADVVGLLHVAAYLPESREQRGWLHFAGREIVLQLRGQFYADGANFEGSTCYHRLSSEMMLYGAALMLHLAAERPAEARGWCEGAAPNFHPPPAAPRAPEGKAAAGVWVPFDAGDARRLRGMGWFTESLLRADGTIPQIGDDDSGRFMRLGLGAVPSADLLSHAHLPAAVRAMFAGEESADDGPEARWLRQWVGRGALASPPADELSRSDATFLAYRDFGLFIWNRGRYRLTLRCGPVGQNGNGGHAHSDQLAVTLDVDGKAIIIDPGTGLYTPDPDLRNYFRSVANHSAIVVPGREPNQWQPGRWGLFAMKDLSHAKVMRADRDGGEFTHVGFGAAVVRTVRVSEDGIEIVDQVPPELAGAQSHWVLAPEARIDAGADLRVTAEGASVRFKFAASGQVRDVKMSPSYGTTRATQAVSAAAGRAELTVAPR